MRVLRRSADPPIQIPPSHFAARNQRSQDRVLALPLPDNYELLEKVRALSTREKPDAAYKHKIDKFFKEMRIEVMARIDEVQAVMNQRAQGLWDFDHAILEQYSKLSAKEALKSAVLDNSEGLEQLSAKIRRTVTGVLSDAEVAAASLASSLD